jgi:hypothetical protein
MMVRSAVFNPIMHENRVKPNQGHIILKPHEETALAVIVSVI